MTSFPKGVGSARETLRLHINLYIQEITFLNVYIENKLGTAEVAKKHYFPRKSHHERG